ncbi:hypothetical protein EJ04DRAFT_28353 [Polyplosphaeria fusca]|uniref:Uncharacterized protein n=1 Tax=Polyplosphaeria fusca TaxID=682080 RepID=A0A9P4QU04_9PLEO|nr:hypothetical protein EJ04DRAFT_28353 [Polyplosphaeria fusca]
MKLSMVSVRKRTLIMWTSIVELNVGLICLCLPVVSVPILNRITKLGHSLSSWLSERRSRRSRRSNEDSGSSNHDESTPALPSVPGGALTGLRSLFRNFDRSRNDDSTQEVTGVGSFSDVESADVSYHAQIKGIQGSRPTIRTEDESRERQ